MSWSIAPGYQHTFNAHTLLTVNPFVRRDQLNYYPSRDPFDDTPVTASQNRVLMNYGVKADLAITTATTTSRSALRSSRPGCSRISQFAITNADYNPVCLDDAGKSAAAAGRTNPDECSGRRMHVPNPNLLPGIVPYDLTRGGSPFNFHATHNINEYAFYIQDTITLGHLTIDAGLRDDQYNGAGLRERSSAAFGAFLSLAYQHRVASLLRSHFRNAV